MDVPRCGTPYVVYLHPKSKKSRTKNDNAMEGLFIIFLVATSVGSLLNDYVNEAKKVKGER